MFEENAVVCPTQSQWNSLEGWISENISGTPASDSPGWWRGAEGGRLAANRRNQIFMAPKKESQVASDFRPAPSKTTCSENWPFPTNMLLKHHALWFMFYKLLYILFTSTRDHSCFTFPYGFLKKKNTVLATSGTEKKNKKERKSLACFKQCAKM